MDFRFIAFNMMLCTSWGKNEIEEMIQGKLDEKTNGIVKIEYNQLAENKIRLVFWRDSLDATDKDFVILFQVFQYQLSDLERKNSH